MAIGSVIDLLVTSFVLPVTAELVERQQLQQGLQHLATLVTQVCAWVCPAGKMGLLQTTV